MSPNDADGIANSVDPDQIAPLGLHCLPRPILSKNIGSLATVKKKNGHPCPTENAATILKLEQNLSHTVKQPKYVDRMANSVDPDGLIRLFLQEQSDLDLYYLPGPSRRRGPYQPSGPGPGPRAVHRTSQCPKLMLLLLFTSAMNNNLVISFIT